MSAGTTEWVGTVEERDARLDLLEAWKMMRRTREGEANRTDTEQGSEKADGSPEHGETESLPMIGVNTHPVPNLWRAKGSPANAGHRCA
jgi:hypothetical protein